MILPLLPPLTVTSVFAVDILRGVLGCVKVTLCEVVQPLLTLIKYVPAARPETVYGFAPVVGIILLEASLTTTAPPETENVNAPVAPPLQRILV